MLSYNKKTLLFLFITFSTIVLTVVGIAVTRTHGHSKKSVALQYLTAVGYPIDKEGEARDVFALDNLKRIESMPPTYMAHAVGKGYFDRVVFALDKDNSVGDIKYYTETTIPPDGVVHVVTSISGVAGDVPEHNVLLNQGEEWVWQHENSNIVFRTYIAPVGTSKVRAMVTVSESQ